MSLRRAIVAPRSGLGAVGIEGAHGRLRRSTCYATPQRTGRSLGDARWAVALLYLNGEMVDESEAKISVNDRGFVFADGIYEVIRVFGGQPFEMQRHIDRLERSAAAIRLTLDPSAEEIGTIALDLLAREDAQEAQIYIQVTRGVAPRSHGIP